MRKKLFVGIISDLVSWRANTMAITIELPSGFILSSLKGLEEQLLESR